MCTIDGESDLLLKCDFDALCVVCDASDPLKVKSYQSCFGLSRTFEDSRSFSILQSMPSKGVNPRIESGRRMWDGARGLPLTPGHPKRILIHSEQTISFQVCLSLFLPTIVFVVSSLQ